MGLFDFLQLVSVLGKDIKKAFVFSGTPINSDYKITHKNIDDMIRIFSSEELMFKSDKIGFKSGREFKYILANNLNDYIGLNPKAFTYKLYCQHAVSIHNFNPSGRQDEDLKILKKIFGY